MFFIFCNKRWIREIRVVYTHQFIYRIKIIEPFVCISCLPKRAVQIKTCSLFIDTENTEYDVTSDHGNKGQRLTNGKL